VANVWQSLTTRRHTKNTSKDMKVSESTVIRGLAVQFDSFRVRHVTTTKLELLGELVGIHMSHWSFSSPALRAAEEESKQGWHARLLQYPIFQHHHRCVKRVCVWMMYNEHRLCKDVQCVNNVCVCFWCVWVWMMWLVCARCNPSFFEDSSRAVQYSWALVHSHFNENEEEEHSITSDSHLLTLILLRYLLDEIHT
jgi:hypothetical protein